MAGTMPRLEDAYSMKTTNPNSITNPAHPQRTHVLLRIYGPCNPSRDPEKLRKRIRAASTQLQYAHTLDIHGKKVPPQKTLISNGEIASFIASLQACARKKDLHRGSRLHDDILKRGMLEKCLDALVTMYAKCGALTEAQNLFNMHKSKNVSSWTSLIAGYAQQGQGHAALDCYEQMLHKGISPDAVTFACVLKACGNIKALDKGEQIHDEAVRHGWLESNVVLGTALVDMYVKCGALAKARGALEELSSRDVFTWSALIAGYSQHGQGEQALRCFEELQGEGLSPTAATYTCILKACGSIGAPDKGERIHDDIVREGILTNDIVLGNALVDMYVKCGALVKAQRVLEELASRDVITWSTLIAGYANQGQGKQALKCYKWMRCEGIFPNFVTFASILKACGSIGALDEGKEIHHEITQQGLLRKNVVLGTALVDMYAKCGSLAKAREVLEGLSSQDVSSWNALMAGYVEHGQGQQALDCFERMLHVGHAPDAVTFVGILRACGSVGAVDKGHNFHDEIVRQGLLGSNVVLGNALVDMYAKFGALAKAREVLEELPSRDVITWSALIAGYAQHGEGEEALKCFERMRCEGLSPNALTFTCILKACGSIGAADKGERLHDHISRLGLPGKDSLLGSALVDMYAKCGALAKAQRVIEELLCRDVNSWNALIAGYAQQGQRERALNCFEKMQSEGVFPDPGTFSCILNACSHLGLIDEGYTYFMDMGARYGMEPGLEHYACMLDLFGRAGHLAEAVRVIQEMPSSQYSAAWTALLSACYKWGDVNVGKWAFEHALEVEKSDEAAYVLMANIYAASGMQKDAKYIKAMRFKKQH